MNAPRAPAGAHTILTVPDTGLINRGRVTAANAYAGHITYGTSRSLRGQLVDARAAGKHLAVRWYALDIRGGRVVGMTCFPCDMWVPNNLLLPDWWPPVVWKSHSTYIYESCECGPVKLFKKIRFAPIIRRYGGRGLSLADARAYLDECYLGVDCMPLPWQYPHYDPLPCEHVHGVAGVDGGPPPVDVPVPPPVDDPSSDDMDEDETDDDDDSSVTVVVEEEDDPPPAYSPLPEYDPPVMPGLLMTGFPLRAHPLAPQ